MKKMIVMGAKGSGKRSLIKAVQGRAAGIDLELFTGKSFGKCDAALLVVSAPDGPMEETLAHLKIAKHSGIPYVICCLNKTDQVDDEDLLELVGLECREMAVSCGYSESDVEIVHTSALADHGMPELIDRIHAGTRPAAPGPAEAAPGGIKCRRCPYAQPAEFEICPSCGAEQKRSFWSRIFG